MNLGWTLELVRYAALTIVEEEDEHVLVLDPLTGEVVHHEVGNGDEVRVDPAITRNMVVLHNHRIDLTFSGEDLAASAEQDCMLAVVVTDRALYFLERPQAGWPKPTVLFFDATMEGSFHGANLLNTCPTTRDGLIHHIAADHGAFYWCERDWRLNLIDDKGR
jgi:hypothetical protein